MSYVLGMELENGGESEVAMNRRGLTLTELLIVIVIIGAMTAFAFPRIGNGLNQQSVRSARTMFITELARARATAIQRGATTRFIVSGAQITIRSRNPVTSVDEQVGAVEDLAQRYGVTLTLVTTPLTVSFDPRGIGATSSTSVSITKGTAGVTITISPIGRAQ